MASTQAGTKTRFDLTTQNTQSSLDVPEFSLALTQKLSSQENMNNSNFITIQQQDTSKPPLPPTQIRQYQQEQLQETNYKIEKPVAKQRKFRDERHGVVVDDFVDVRDTMTKVKLKSLKKT